MLKPTDDELREALAEAERMREHDADPCHIAKSLQYLDHHVRRLEAVFDAAKNYLQFGQEENEHAILVNAIEAARSENLHDMDQEDETLGL
jgi:ribosomal 50S subunit-associated protein YjgA (DUF615 family)